MDRGMLVALCEGDEEAARTFVEQYRSRLEGLARRRGFNVQDAEEIAQDTLAAALAQLRSGRFEERSQLASWVRAIFDRRATDHYRRHGRYRWRTVSMDETPASDVAQTGGVEAGPDNQTTLLVRAVLASLSAKHRMVLLLNVHHGLAAREIATLLRLGVKSTEAILTTARKQFRQQVAEHNARPRPSRLPGR